MDMMDRTSALGLWRYAHEFWQAAEAVHAKFPGKVFVPALYLYSHAVELALKAFLRSQGRTLEQLKALGHNLEAALKAAEDTGLCTFMKLSADDRPALELINLYYRAKELEYIVTGVKRYPTNQSLRNCAEAILRGTKGPCEMTVKKTK